MRNTQAEKERKRREKELEKERAKREKEMEEKERTRKEVRGEWECVVGGKGGVLEASIEWKRGRGCTAALAAGVQPSCAGSPVAPACMHGLLGREIVACRCYTVFSGMQRSALRGHAPLAWCAWRVGA